MLFNTDQVEEICEIAVRKAYAFAVVRQGPLDDLRMAVRAECERRNPILNPQKPAEEDTEYTQQLVELLEKKPLPQEYKNLIVFDDAATAGHTVAVSLREKDVLCVCTCGAQWTDNRGTKYDDLKAKYKAHAAGANRISETL